MRPQDRLRERLRRLEARARRTAERGDQRHHEIDQMLQSNDQIRAQLVAVFNARLDQVEANTARIDTLETQMAAVLDNLKIKLPKGNK